MRCSLTSEGNRAQPGSDTIREISVVRAAGATHDMSGTPVPQSRHGVAPGRRDQEEVESGARAESFNPDGYMRRSIKRRGTWLPRGSIS